MKLSIPKNLLQRLYQCVINEIERTKDNDKKIEELQRLELLLSKYL